MRLPPYFLLFITSLMSVAILPIAPSYPALSQVSTASLSGQVVRVDTKAPGKVGNPSSQFLIEYQTVITAAGLEGTVVDAARRLIPGVLVERLTD